MNSNSTQRWLARIVMPLTVLLVFVQGAQAQCDITWPGSPNPVQFSIVIDPVTGDAELNYIAVSANGVTSSMCGPLSNAKVRFYTSAAKTTLVNPAEPYHVLFDCSDVNQPATTAWVAIYDGVDLATESQAVPIQVSIIDLTKPTFGTPPADITVYTSDDGGGDCLIQDIYFWTFQDIGLGYWPAPPPGFNQYFDNCPDGLTVTYKLSGATNLPEGPAPGGFGPYDYDAGLATFNLGTTTVTYYIYDDYVDPMHTMRDSVVTHVTLIDDENPVANCGIIPLYTFNTSDDNGTNPSDCATELFLNFGESDNCGVASSGWVITGAGSTPGSGSGNFGDAFFNLGTSTVTFTVTDGGGLTASCSFDVAIVDDEAPTISCPADMTVDALPVQPNCYYVATALQNYTGYSDNCGVSAVSNNYTGVAPLTGTNFPLGNNTIIWQAADAAANTGTCSFVLTVIDNTPPPGPDSSNTITVNVTPGDCSATVSYEYPGLFFFDPGLIDCSFPVTLTEGPAIVNDSVDANFLLQLPPFDPFKGRMNFIFGAGATMTFPVGTTVIPYTWTDAAGNDSTELITVIVNENLPPTAKCKPGIITLPLNASGQATLTTAMVDNGSVDNCNLDTLYLSNTAFTCANLPGTTTVTLTAADASGNTATCTATIDIVDNIAPQILCPGNKTVTTNVGCTNNAVPDIGVAAGGSPLMAGQYSDNCSVTSVTWQLSGATVAGPVAGSLPANTAFNKGVTTVTYTVADASGNNAVCNFTVNVVDNTPPVWTGIGQAPGSTITANANIGGCVGQVTWMPPTFTDACTAVPPVTVTSTHSPGSFFVFGMTTVTYTAIDGVGNATTHTFTINIVDTQAPVAKCKDITVSLDGMGFATVTAPQVDNLSTDNCFFTYTSPSTTYDCSDLGNNSYVLQITDGSGNSSTCVSTVKVQDLIPPTALCNSVSPVNLSPAGTFTLNATTVNNNSTDNTYPLCGLTYAVSVDGSAYQSSFTFTCAHLGNRVLTLKVTDAAGNTATCSQVVLVKDVTPPSISGPANITINCDASTAPANTGTYSNVSDNCDPNPAVVQLPDVLIPGACANARTILRTWRATDASGNSATVSHTITVQDVTKPVFHIQNSIVLKTNDPNNCNAPLVLKLTQDSVTDNCTSIFANFNIQYTVDYPTPSYGYLDVLVFTPGSMIPIGSFPIGTTVVTWRVTDECGNSTSASVSITVQDTKGPVFTSGYAANCGKSYVLPNTSGACSNLFSWARPNKAFPDVTDCLSFTVSEQISNPTVQAALNLTNPFNYNTSSSFQVFPTAQFPVGITTVTYVAVDAAGNSATCAFTVEVQDIQPPALTCPPNQILLATCPTAQIPNYTNLVQVSDNCNGNIQLSQSIAAGTTLGAIFAPNPPAAGNQFTINVTGTDGYNTSNCSFTVTLQDGEAPIPTVATLPALVDSCGTLIVLAPTALDPCNPNADTIFATPSTPVGTFLNTNPPSYQLNPGNYVITWVYNDGNGNISTQPQNITVLVDIFPPVAICVPNLTVNLHPVTGKAGISSGQLNNGSFDPNHCGPLSFSVSPDTLTCANAGPSPTIVTLTVRDAKNNPATCTTSVTVKDVTAPNLPPAPANVTIEACDPIPAAVNLTATDACAGALNIVPTSVSTQDTTGGLLKYNYTITRTWVATDASGNSTVTTQTVTVKDTKKPVFTGAPTMVMVTTDPDRVTCDDTVNINILPFVSDCAKGADLSVTNNKEPGDGGNLSAIFSVGTHTVIFTANDISGNSATYSVTVIVKDGTPPTAVCINGVSAALQPSGTVVVNVAQFNNNSSDNCTGAGSLDLKIQRLDDNPLHTPSSTLTYDCDDADGVTHHPVKLFVQDQAGNMSMCETYIVIQDNVVPTITLCPADKVVLCSDSLLTSAHGTALATDNCPNNVTIEYTDVPEVDTAGDYCYRIRRIWTASDLANNTATCVQTFNVIDTIAPALSQYPVDITISCSENLAPPSNITASDNCADSIAVTFVQDTVDIAPGLCGKYSYTVTRTRTAVDDCGNIVTHTNNITVVDDEGPQFPGLPDTLVVQSANFPANNNCVVPVALNVAQYIVDCAPISELLVLNDAPHGNDSLDASGNYSIGTYTVHFTASDPCGNLGADSIVVIAIDNSKPTAICNNNVVVSLGTDGKATIQPDDIDLGSTDNCGIDTMFLSVSTFDCSDLGTQPITLTVVDPYGNANTCTVNVNVTLGNGAGFNLTTNGTPETYFGADNGSAVALASGGSGTFSYQWSNNGATASISNLSAGTYTVTVTDSGTGCIQTDTAIVQAGAKLTITAGNAGGAQGAMVNVPVTVANFNAMVGMSFSMHVTNNAVGTILGAVNPNPALTGIGLNLVGNSLTVFWANATPVNLTNGSVLFDLKVQLGNAPVGSTSPVTIDGTPTVLSFQQDSAGSIVPTMANLNAGSVTIDSMMANDILISGLIKTWSGAGTPVPGVTVGLTGSVTDSKITDAAGNYAFTLPFNTSGTLTPKKSVTSNFSQGINVGDLLAIQNHAASVTPLANPYQFVAGDVNNNNKVDLPDYLLVQQLILGTVQHYSNGAPDWKFVAQPYTFPSPNPLSAAFPQTASFNCCFDSILDFKAVRMGDVTGNAPVNNLLGNNIDDRSGETFKFRLDNRAVHAGEVFSVPFKASDFNNRQAYQMTIGFDPNVVELVDIQTGVLPNLNSGNFGTAQLADGYLTTLWVSVDPLTLPEGEVLFTLTFRALHNSAALSDVLRPGSEITFAEALDVYGNSMNIEFDFEQALGNPDLDGTAFALFQNQPNPFREETTIGFRLPQAGRAILRVYSADGRLVKTVVGNFAQGYNSVVFHQGEFGTPGVYWYELESATHSDRKKMILID